MRGADRGPASVPRVQRRVQRTDRHADARAALAVGGLAVAGALLRLPFVGVPLDADEGGYAYLAQRWAAGGRLYGDVWVDRPQGLMLVYRAVVTVSTWPGAIRVAAMVAGIAVTVGVAGAAWALRGRGAAVLAAGLSAAVLVAPRLQGFLLNGELLAAAFAAPAVALALAWRARDGDSGGDRGGWWLLSAAGAVGGAAVLMKQSGFDGLAVVAVVAATARGRRGRALLAAAAGAALPLGAALLAAALTSWSQWWFAVVGYRLEADGTGSLLTRATRLGGSLLTDGPWLLPLAAVAAWGAVVCWRRREGVPLVWLGAAAVGLLGGQFFFPHYYVQLLPPLVLLATLGVLALSPVRARWAVGVVVVPSLLTVLVVALLTPDLRDRFAMPNDRLLANRQIAPWLRAHAAPGDSVYAFVSSADLYYLSGRGTDFRYLWRANIEAIPGEVDQLRAWLASPDAPRWVVVYQQPDDVDPSGRIAQVLAARYQQVARIDGMPVLRLR